MTTAPILEILLKQLLIKQDARLVSSNFWVAQELPPEYWGIRTLLAFVDTIITL